MRNTIDNLMLHPFVNVIKHYEGWYPEAYTCPAGKWTIGWGHLCHKNLPPITMTQGQLYLKEDLNIALTALERLCPDIVQGPSHRCIALVSWVFNLGQGNLASSTLLRRLLAEDFERAGSEILRWNKVTGKDGVKRVLPGLVKRRQSESHMFLTGEVKIF